MSTQDIVILPPVSPPLIIESAAAPTPRAPQTVLLVEDDRSIRRYLEVILQRAGYRVVLAADGLEAMKATLSSAIDAVVTDAVMPHLNGYEFCRFLRRHPKLSRTPVVLLSGIDHKERQQQRQHLLSDEPHAAAAGEYEADAYLSKPVRPEELTDCVARLLEQAA